MKNYTINIDMKWSADIHLKAKTKAEAKKKAWNKFKNRVPKKLFELIAEEF